MTWWEDAEARALRARTPAGTGLLLWQRMQAAGLDPDLAFTPAYDLARLQDLCADFVKLLEGVLLLSDGDHNGLRRHLLALQRWAQYAAQWTEVSSAAFNQLMDALDLGPDVLAGRAEEDPSESGGAPPAEQAKVDGRYRHWHLLYERLDLKMAAAGLSENVRHALARILSRLYEECLVATRAVGALEREASPRFGQVARTLLGINTAWHFDLGPNHLGAGRARANGSTSLGVQTWLLLALAREGRTISPSP